MELVWSSGPNRSKSRAIEIYSAFQVNGRELTLTRHKIFLLDVNTFSSHELAFSVVLFCSLYYKEIKYP